MDEKLLQFRFTIADLCLATVLASACFAVLTSPYPERVFRIFSALILAGAAFGALFGSARKGAVAGFTFFVAIGCVLLIFARW